MSNQVKDMTWREVQERLREFPVVIVPIGSTEQHGYHLPIGTDVYLAEALAEKTAEKTGALVYPSIHFGYSWSWRDRIGTVTIRQDILREILKDVVRSVERYGVKILIFTLEGRTDEQGTWKEKGMGKQLNNRTSEQFNN